MKNVAEDFEGFVTEVHEDTFWVRLWDQDEEELHVEFETKKVLQDVEYLDVGRPCSLTLFSDETFDFRLIVEFWTQEEIDKIKKDAKEFSKKIKWKEEADE